MIVQRVCNLVSTRVILCTYSINKNNNSYIRGQPVNQNSSNQSFRNREDSYMKRDPRSKPGSKGYTAGYKNKKYSSKPITKQGQKKVEHEIESHEEQLFQEQVDIPSGPIVDLIKSNYFPNKVLESIINELGETISKQEHQQILTKLLETKLKTSDSLVPILTYFTSHKQQPQLESRFLSKYLMHLSNQNSPSINLDVVLGLHPSNITTHKKRIHKLSLHHPNLILQLFKYSTLYSLTTNDELRVYDQYFSDHLNQYSLIQQIEILQSFAETEKKGLYIQLFKQKLIQDLSHLQLINKHLFLILLSYTRLKETSGIQKLEQRLILSFLNNKFSLKQIAFIIQIFHKNSVGSPDFWRVFRSNSQQLEVNELFAVLSGMFRINEYDEQLLMDMIIKDNEIQLIHPGLVEDEFLKVMLVYYGNYLVMGRSNKQVVQRLLKKRLEEVYQTVRYKKNVNLFMWLFKVEVEETEQGQLDEMMKICYFQPYEKALLGLRFDVGYQPSEEDKEFMEREYREVNKLSIVQEIIIRRMDMK